MASLGREGASFRLLGNPVTIRWMFFVGALVIGASMRRDPASIVVWILVVAVAVLLHELGHALVARSLGFDPSIELHVIGGLTTWAWTRRPRWFERLGTSLAGPAIGFAAAAALWPLLPLLKSAGVPPLLRLAAGDFLWVTIVWGIFNLLPILPLDGGSAVESLLLGWRAPADARRIARIVSVATGIACALAGFWLGLSFAGALCGLFAYDNYAQMRRAVASPQA